LKNNANEDDHDDFKLKVNANSKTCM